MTKFLLTLHLVFAVFAVGPLVHAATTAGRGIRRGDAAATASSARMLRIYAYASVLVVIAGIGLMSRPASTSGRYAYSPLTRNNIDYLATVPNQHIASFGDTWIWLSIVLWALAIALVLLVLVPSLKRATTLIGGNGSAGALTGRVAAAGGVVALIFVVIVVLMVYRPGS